MSFKIGDIVTAGCGCIGVYNGVYNKIKSNWLSKHGFIFGLRSIETNFYDIRLSTPEEIKEYKSHLFKAELMYKSGEIVKFDNEF